MTASPKTKASPASSIGLSFVVAAWRGNARIETTVVGRCERRAKRCAHIGKKWMDAGHPGQRSRFQIIKLFTHNPSMPPIGGSSHPATMRPQASFDRPALGDDDEAVRVAWATDDFDRLAILRHAA